jgi:hypothetical protein
MTTDRADTLSPFVQVTEQVPPFSCVTWDTTRPNRTGAGIGPASPELAPWSVHSPSIALSRDSVPSDSENWDVVSKRRPCNEFVAKENRQIEKEETERHGHERGRERQK